MDVYLQPRFFSIVKENAFHRRHNSWPTEEVVHHVALAIVAGSCAIRNLFLRLMLRHVVAIPLSGPEGRLCSMLPIAELELREARLWTELQKNDRSTLFAHGHVLNRTGQQGNVYQAHQQRKWNPRSAAYGRFWVDFPSGERKRRTVSLGLCATQWVARLRLRENIERAGVCSKHRFHRIPVPGTTFRQQAEWWMESLYA